jgi:uncharacterized protein (TIGR03067 family)
VLDGTWIAVSAELGGTTMPAAALSTIRLVLSDGHYTLGNDRGSYHVDERVTPAAIDVAGSDGPSSGRQIPAIFEFSDGLLRICYDLSCTARPKTFHSSVGSKLFLVTYRREELDGRK